MNISTTPVALKSSNQPPVTHIPHTEPMTEPQLPKARWQVALASVHLGVLSIRDALLLVITAIVACLSALVIGIVTVPTTLRIVRAASERTRAVCQQLSGLNCSVRYLHAPDAFAVTAAGPLRFREAVALLSDSATRRDLIWILCNPIVGTVLGFLAPGMMVDAVLGVGWSIVDAVNDSEFNSGSWYSLFELASIDTIAAAGAFAVVEFALGWMLLRPMLQSQCRWVQQRLGPNTSQLVDRVATLEHSREDALDYQRAEIARIERDLHDGTQAELVAIGMQLSEVELLLESEPDHAREILATAKHQTASALRELRQLVHGIQPVILNDRGLADAIRQRAEDTRIPVRFASNLTERLAAPLESALYFATSELITNVVKHANASKIEVNLHADTAAKEPVVTVTVTDNGNGGATMGTGLLGVQRRLQHFDASLTLSSPTGGPTQATIKAPYRSMQEH